jgi:chromosome partitioning protein
VAFLRRHNLPIIPAAIGNRRSYARAVSSGRAVTEFEPRGKAAQEIRAVWAWVKERLNGPA